MSAARGRLDSHDSEMTIASANQNLSTITPPLPTSTSTTPTRVPSPVNLESGTLPPGCKYGQLPPGSASDEKRSDQVIWVDFPRGSPDNPFTFSARRKKTIVAVAVFYSFITAFATSSWSIGMESMTADLNITHVQGAAGLAIYAWGFGVAPMALAPLSEELGRRWTYLTALFIYWQSHLFFSLGQNLPTILIGRFIQGAAGSVGATLVGGTISDMFTPDQRGIPMAVFGTSAIFGTGFGPLTMSWIEARPDLGWRWIQWVQYIATGIYLPIVFFVVRETRAPVLLQRRAKKLRVKTGDKRYMARSEVNKVKFSQAMQHSLLRPISFLLFEPIVTFFSIWVALGWGVFYTQIAGLTYVFGVIYGFKITSVGLIYTSICIGSLIGFCFNFVTEAIFRRKAPIKGTEARLYGPMVAGISFAAGCFIFGFTGSSGNIHWIVPCIGIVILIASILTIYICCFTYLSECYGSHASSAIAAQSFLRNMFGGAFSLFTTPMFESLTTRWAIFIFGCIATVLAVVPFVAFWRGPRIRARSKMSRKLMAEERARIEAEGLGDGPGGRELERDTAAEEEAVGSGPKSQAAA